MNAGLSQRPRGLRAVVPIAAAMLLLTTTVGISMALTTPPIPTSLFEIQDGNVSDDANPAPDWDTVLGPGNVVASTQPTGTVATSFFSDPLAFDPLTAPDCTSGSGDPTVFTGAGGEKNGDAFSSMTWGAGSIPNNKDDLSNVYAYSKRDGDNHLVLFFGLERVGTNGASHIDFEFLKSEVGADVPASARMAAPRAASAAPERSATC